MAEKTDAYNRDEKRGLYRAMGELVTVLVNGETYKIPSGSSVVALLKHLALPSDRVAVELNKMIVRKRDWEATLVESQARLEIVEFVGGG